MDFCFGRCLQVMDFTILLSFSFTVEWAKILGYRSTESSLRKACLVRVRHCVANRTLVAANFSVFIVGTERFLLSRLPYHCTWFFKVLPLSPLWVWTAKTWRPQWMQCRACTSIAERQVKGEAKMLPLLLNRIDCHIYHCASLKHDRKFSITKLAIYPRSKRV